MDWSIELSVLRWMKEDGFGKWLAIGIALVVLFLLFEKVRAFICGTLATLTFGGLIGIIANIINGDSLKDMFNMEIKLILALIIFLFLSCILSDTADNFECCIDLIFDGISMFLMLIMFCSIFLIPIVLGAAKGAGKRDRYP